ncbi:MAG: DUF3306 domain-containing protein [Gammaproteobacteria bacterium]|nr:DUF3306 domain-containing protein [Gammaproteobacteria bacterium]
MDKRKTNRCLDEPLQETADEGVLSRWSRLKSQAERTAEVPISQGADTDRTVPNHFKEPVPGEHKTDADMPPIDSLGEHSDYSGFFSPKVSEELRRLALRKLFHTAKFNITDGLDDYDEDFRSFEALGDLVTADMRYHLERTAEQVEENAKQDPPIEEPVKEQDLESPAAESLRVERQGMDTHTTNFQNAVLDGDSDRSK